MNTTRKLLALAAAGSLVLAACGSDDNESAAPDSAAPVETTGSPETTEGGATDTAGATETTEGGATETTEAGTDDAVFVLDPSQCDDPDAATAQIEGSLKIGTSLPLSGGPAVLFAPFAAGAQAYIDYYNAEFGGINGEPIELIVKDDQYTADLTKANVDKLIFDDGVHMLSGIVGSDNNLAIRDDTNAQCIPQLNAATGASAWGEIDSYPFVTGLLVPYEIETRIFGDYISEQVGEGAKVAIFYANTEFGQSYLDALRVYADEHGLEIVAEETIEPTDSGAPSAQMTNMVQAAPDAILAAPVGAQCIAFMQELGNAKAANADFDPLVYQTGTCASPIFFKAAANGGADGVMTSTNVLDASNPDLAEDDGMKVYLAAMASYAPDADASSQVGMAGWLAMELGVLAAQEAFDAGDYSRVGIINAARNVDYAPKLLLEGLRAHMDANDAYIGEGTQLVAWSDETGHLVPFGEVKNYEGSLGVFGR